MNKISVIILNWNGFKDTIECLDSLMGNDRSLFDITIIDNGSRDESILQIQLWFQDQKLELVTVPPATIPNDFSVFKSGRSGSFPVPTGNSFTLIPSEDNLGFSAGNNLGMRYALMQKYQFILLLNNDTTLEPDTIQKIHTAMTLHPQWGVCVPKIKYYDSPEKIWNCGGFIRPLGGRKYLHPDSQDNQAYSGFQRITFATGCALTLRPRVIIEHGGLSEDFFFGEEDYEFSKRLFGNKVPMYALLDAVIYHKVGISRTKLLDQNNLAGVFTHHLNRLIHMKRYMSAIQWKIWRFGSLIYIFFLLTVKKRTPISIKLFKYLFGLKKLSDDHTVVDRDLFLKSKELLK